MDSRVADGLHPALVRAVLEDGAAAAADEGGEDNAGGREQGGHDQHDEDGEIIGQHREINPEQAKGLQSARTRYRPSPPLSRSRSCRRTRSRAPDLSSTFGE